MRLPSPLASLLGAALLAFPLAAQQPAPSRPPSRGAPPTSTKGAAPKSQPAASDTTPAPSTVAYLQGVAYDSIHAQALTHALISVEGTTRLGFSDSLGRFLLDSVPPGSHRVLVQHPLLDTLGISLITPPMSFTANMVTQTVIAVPSGEYLVSLFCPAARRALGPGALVGRVREPDSDSAAVGARVSFVWYDPDPPGLPANLRVTKKPPRVREATVGDDGIYRLCGLPEKYEGKLQAQRKDGGETAEVTVTQELGMLALRSVSVAARPTLAAGDTGAARQPRGSARVSGVVLNRSGAPVANARVGLMGASAATMTKANGEFVLDSLPAGTQALVVRQIGYSPTEVPVELSAFRPARVTVKLGVLVPQLSPVEVLSRREEGLQKVGFLDRKRTSAGGYFITGEDLERRKPIRFTDVLRTTPGLRVSEVNGQAMIASTRSAQGNGCVTVFVDGAPWQQLDPGDLDTFVQPNEVAAIEVYNGASIPAQFTTPGQSCSAVVVWTKTRVDARRR
ncbi:MAG TPA: carboxypeptidase regulatory-like domain-containing protein [Gemmatimonadaceae bacterium]|nr:carboxypeptidase regulatory-like domain-containing protein [Gemmatimonadaceae bacterium]